MQTNSNIITQVSDVDNDVRRAAVTGLGFILFRYHHHHFLASHSTTMLTYYCMGYIV